MSINELVDDFCRSLRRRHVEGSLATGKRTAELLRILITSQRHADAQALLDDVRRIGIKIQSAKPLGGWVCHDHCLHPNMQACIAPAIMACLAGLEQFCKIKMQHSLLGSRVPSHCVS